MYDFNSLCITIILPENNGTIFEILHTLIYTLGHGPFSHMFDNQFIPKISPGSTWKVKLV